MNKLEFIEAVAEKSGLSKKDAEKAVTGGIDVITEALKKNEDVQITGFGKFVAAKRAAKTGRNPSTGQHMTIAARVSPKFVPGTESQQPYTSSRSSVQYLAFSSHIPFLPA